ncbi:MAG: TonB-dependent receptor [Marinilabiliaceae bacterium]|nr:TonB-dependent receptor [Marinilabiliaceae bacterium]
MKYKFIMMLMLLISTVAFAQEKTITGKIIDQTGETVIGASLIIDGTTLGTVTDFDGNFTLKAPVGAKINVSFIGYESTSFVVTAEQDKYDLTLNDETSDLEEIVVVGYGVQKKAHLTGSVSTVEMESVQDMSSGNLASTLTGLVNGLSVSGGNTKPGENAEIYIRNTATLSEVGSTAQQPLFVIDGYIYPNDIKVGSTTQNYGAEAFNNLDPSVIESISVLKDASAAVYGARAANGVILVTTKKGKQGEPQISYSGNFGFTDAVCKPKMLSAYNYGRMYNAVTAADPTSTSLKPKEDLFQQDELEAMKKLNYDLLDKYWEVGFTQQHSINVSGASEKANYFASVSYFNQDGNLGKLDYDRWNYRAGVDVTIADWLKANLTVNGDNGKKNTPLVKIGGSGNDKDYFLLLTHPYYIPEYVNGLPIAAYGPSNTIVSNDQYYNFSLLQNNGDYSKTVNQNTTFNAGLEYDFGWNEYLKGLKVKVAYSKSISTDKTNQYASSFTIYKMTNRFGSGSHLYTPVSNENDNSTLLNESNFTSSEISNGTPSYLSRNTTRTDNYQVNFNVSYNRTFADIHSVGLFFSIERSEAESEYLIGTVTKPTEYTSGQSNSVADGSEQTTTFTRSESGSLSYIGRVNYAYLDKYLVEFLLRADASTKFAPRNYWGKFPSVSLGWVMSQEDWFYDIAPWASFAKLRGSFGLTGRDNAAAWQWQQVYAQDKDKGSVFGTATGTASTNRVTINKDNSAVNEDIHWDKSYKGDIGFDLNVLDNKLSATFDYYRNWDREMLMNISQSIPTTVGSQSASTNLGEMDSWGYELSLTWKDKIGEDVNYSVGINTGYNDNKVRVMDWKTDYQYRQIQKDGRSDIGTWGMQCIGMFRSFQDIYEYFDKYHITSYMGMSIDKVRPGMLMYKDVRGAQQNDGSYAAPDGVVNKDNDQVRLSNRTNPYGATMNLKVSWKGLSFSSQFNVSWGGYSFLPAYAIKFANDMAYTNMPSFWNPDNMYVYQDITDGSGNVVMKQNRNAELPNLAYASVNSVTSSFWRVSGTRARWTRATISYTVPKDFVKKLHLNSVRLNLTGQNLLSFYNPYKDYDKFIDPMTSYGSYPVLRKFTLGVNVSF